MSRRLLTAEERQELCELFAKGGHGDLLDFIEYIQRTCRKYQWDVDLMLSVLRNMPAEKRDAT